MGHPFSDWESIDTGSVFGFEERPRDLWNAHGVENGIVGKV